MVHQWADRVSFLVSAGSAILVLLKQLHASM